MRNFSRREFTAILLAPFARAQSPRAESRTYRADAVILFLGLTIYRRAGVGGAQASLVEEGEGASLRRTLFFAGGSDPKRARGLNRLGWIREVVVGPEAAPSEATYFGVLSSSPEESLEHARKVVEAAPPGRATFSAVSGQNTPGHSHSAITHFEDAAGAIWSDRALIDHAHAAFQNKIDWRDTAWPKSPNQAPPTFLSQLATLLKQRSRRATGRYVYNEQEFLLELDASAAPDRDRLRPVRGRTRNLRTGKENLFRVWLEDTPGAIVPVRIEYQARSFLRLTFEAV